MILVNVVKIQKQNRSAVATQINANVPKNAYVVTAAKILTAAKNNHLSRSQPLFLGLGPDLN